MSDEKINGYSADQLFTMWPRQFALLLKDALSGFNFLTAIFNSSGPRHSFAIKGQDPSGKTFLKSYSI